MDIAEAPGKLAAGVDEDDLDSISEQSNADKSTSSRKDRDSHSHKRGNKAGHLEEEEEELEEDILETEWDKEQPEDEEEEGHKPFGVLIMFEAIPWRSFGFG